MRDKYSDLKYVAEINFEEKTKLIKKKQLFKNKKSMWMKKKMKTCKSKFDTVFAWGRNWVKKCREWTLRQLFKFSVYLLRGNKVDLKESI